MNKGTAIIGCLLSFLAGSGLTWAVAHTRDGAPSARLSADAASVSHSSSPIPISAGDATWGSADAPVTIVELSDFECPFCSRVTATVAQIKREYGPEKLRLVWKNNPSPSHPNARPAAEAAATVVGLGGDFWKFHDLAMGHQKELGADNLSSWAVASGIGASDFDAALRARRFSAKVDEDIALARRIGARGTPHFRINGKALSGAQPLDKFKELIDAELGAANALAASGVPRARLSFERTKKNFVAPPPDKPRTTTAPPEDTRVWKIPVGDTDPSKGPRDALVTIVELSDFQCPYCSRVIETMDQLLTKYGADVRLVWKDSPASFHPRARAAASFGRFVFERRGNDGFWAAHDALFASQNNLEDASLERVATQLGLDWREAAKAIHSDRYARDIDQSLAFLRDFEVSGTPAFFINGRKLVGLQPPETFERLIETQLGSARALERRGVPRANVYRELMKTALGAPEPEKKVVPAPTRDNPVKGPGDARVTINVFSDFQCPYCARVEPTLAQVRAAYPKDVKIVWRHLPMPFHPDAALAAEAAHEAFDQKGNDGFWNYQSRLFDNQKAIARADLERYATELELDMAAFRAALDGHEHRPQIDRDVAAARQAGISATPGFTVNGYFLSGAHPFAAYDRLIQRALADNKR